MHALLYTEWVVCLGDLVFSLSPWSGSDVSNGSGKVRMANAINHKYDNMQHYTYKLCTYNMLIGAQNKLNATHRKTCANAHSYTCRRWMNIKLKPQFHLAMGLQWSEIIIYFRWLNNTRFEHHARIKWLFNGCCSGVVAKALKWAGGVHE